LKIDEEKVSKRRKREKKSGMILKIILPLILVVAMVTVAFSFSIHRKILQVLLGLLVI